MAKLATFTERHPIYKCKECKRQTRCTDETNYSDAEFNGLCSTCWDLCELELEHEEWELNEGEHPNQGTCKECK